MATRSRSALRRLTRDLYIPTGDVGFWQGAIREADDDGRALVTKRIADHDRVMVDLLYGDHYGGQRLISRFSLQEREDGSFLLTVGRHWNVDRPDPR